MRRGVTAYTIDKRTATLELAMGVTGTPEQETAQALLTAWILADDTAAGLIAEFEDMAEIGDPNALPVARVLMQPGGPELLQRVTKGLCAAADSMRPQNGGMPIPDLPTVP